MKVGNIEIIKLIEQSGIALYGERWKTALSADLNISYRTMQNWLDGDYAPKPEIVLPQLHQLLKQNSNELGNLIVRIEGGMMRKRNT